MGNDYGNLLMRVLKLSLGHLPPKVKGEGVEQKIDFSNTFEEMKIFMQNFDHTKALNVLWKSIHEANHYVNEVAPWKFKKDQKKLTSFVYNACFALHQLALLLGPFLPDSSEKTLAAISPSEKAWKGSQFGQITYFLTSPPVLFPRIL